MQIILMENIKRMRSKLKCEGEKQRITIENERLKSKGGKSKSSGRKKVQIVLRERWFKCEEAKKDYVGEIKSHKSEGGK